jgi:hypothetical protein
MHPPLQQPIAQRVFAPQPPAAEPADDRPQDRPAEPKPATAAERAEPAEPTEPAEHAEPSELAELAEPALFSPSAQPAETPASSAAAQQFLHGHTIEQHATRSQPPRGLAARQLAESPSEAARQAEDGYLHSWLHSVAKSSAAAATLSTTAADPPPPRPCEVSRSSSDLALALEQARRAKEVYGAVIEGVEKRRSESPELRPSSSKPALRSRPRAATGLPPRSPVPFGRGLPFRGGDADTSIDAKASHDTPVDTPSGTGQARSSEGLADGFPRSLRRRSKDSSRAAASPSGSESSANGTPGRSPVFECYCESGPDKPCVCGGRNWQPRVIQEYANQMEMGALRLSRGSKANGSGSSASSKSASG